MGEEEGLPLALGVLDTLGVGAATENVARTLTLTLADADEVRQSVGVGVGEDMALGEAEWEVLPVALAADDGEGEVEPLLEEVGDALAEPAAVAELHSEERGEGVEPPPPGAAATLGVAEPDTLSNTWVRVAQLDSVWLADGEPVCEREGRALAEPTSVAESHTLPDGVDVPPVLGVATPVGVPHAWVRVAHPDTVWLVEGEALLERVVEPEPLGMALLLGEPVEEPTEAVPHHEAVAVPQPECWGLALPLAVVLPLAVALSDSEKVGPALLEPEPEKLGDPEALEEPEALLCALPVPAMVREPVPQPVGDTLGEAEGEPPASEGDAVTLRVGDPRPLGDVEALAQRVGLRVSVPLTLTLRERVTEVVSEPEEDSEGLAAGLPLGLGEGDSLPLAEALSEPLPLAEALSEPLPLLEALPQAVPLLIALPDARGVEEAHKVPEPLPVALLLALVLEGVLEPEVDRRGVDVPVVEGLTLRDRVPQAVVEAERVTDTVAEPLRETEGEGVWLALPLGLCVALPHALMQAEAVVEEVAVAHTVALWVGELVPAARLPVGAPVRVPLRLGVAELHLVLVGELLGVNDVERLRLLQAVEEGERVPDSVALGLCEALVEGVAVPPPPPPPSALPEGDPLALAQPEGDTLLEAQGEPEGVWEGVVEAVPVAEPPRAREGEAVPLLHRVPLRVSVPEALVDRERVPEDETEGVRAGVGLPCTLRDWEGEGVALTLPLGLGERLLLCEPLGEPEGEGRATVPDPTPLREGLGVGERGAVPLVLPRSEGLAVAEALRQPVGELEGVRDAERVRLLQGVAEAERVTDTEAEELRVELTEGVAVRWGVRVESAPLAEPLGVDEVEKEGEVVAELAREGDAEAEGHCEAVGDRAPVALEQRVVLRVKDGLGEQERERESVGDTLKERLPVGEAVAVEVAEDESVKICRRLCGSAANTA